MPKKKSASLQPAKALVAEPLDYDVSSRTIRIFISSTFRDFTQERDLLVRKVFPELRRRCRERQVELIDVDLRWGITEEEAQQGRVLPICLAEIDRARPFFMGLFGERYGWVPAAEQFDQSLLIEQPWLDEHRGGKSVTELEILHGVLNNPEMAGRAFFYFRDSAWSQKQGDDYASEGVSEKQKLLILKDWIRSSGFPVVEDYPDPETLAERVREDLWSLIDAAYPESEMPDARSLERQRHSAYGASRRRLYLGGERYFKALDDELATDAPRPVLVTGQSGGGKSALLSNWLARWQPAHAEAAVIMHHLGCGADAADPVRLVVRLMQEFARLTGEKFEPKSDPDEQLDDLPQWLAIASVWAERTDRTVLIVLDGLDKLSDRRHLRWFPMALPPRVSFVASCLVGAVLDAAHTRLDWQDLVIEPLSATEQSRFIVDFLGRYRKQLTPPQTRSLQSHPLSGNPLFLLTVLEELRVFGVHEELEQRLATLLSPPPSKQHGEEPTVDDAFEHVLARIEQDLGREQVQRVMEAIWASRAGLYNDEILAIAEVAPATWAGIANALDESLYESSGRINFGHDYLRKAVADRYAITGDERLGLHRRLAEYFDGMEPNARVAEELPWQWQQAADLSRLHACLIQWDLIPFLRRDHSELLAYWRVLQVPDVSAEYHKVFTRRGMKVTIDHLLIGDFLYFAGHYDDFVESIYRIWVRLFRDSGKLEFFSCINELGALLLMRGKPHDAVELLRTEWLDAKTPLPPDDPLSLLLLSTFSCSLVSIGHKDAEWACRRVIELLEHCGRTATKEYGLALYNLGVHLHYAQETTQSDDALVEADELFRKAYDVLLTALGPLHAETLKALLARAPIFCTNEKWDEAMAIASEASDGFVRTVGPSHPEALRAIGIIGQILIGRGDNAEAEALLRQIVLQAAKTLGEQHATTLEFYAVLGTAVANQRRYKEAKEYFDKAKKGALATIGANSPVYKAIARQAKEARKTD